jgi:hypothetical protein
MTTAVVSNENQKRLQSSQSSRSVATPSKLQTDLNSTGETLGDKSIAEESPMELSNANPTPRRLPPLETKTMGETLMS